MISALAEVRARRSLLQPAFERTQALYQVDRITSLDEFLARAARINDASSRLPFHSTAWLRAWYETLGRSGGRSPLWLAVRQPAGAGDAALFPLSVRRERGLSIVEFADAGVVDYVSPILAPDWAGPAITAMADLRLRAAALWAALKAALTGHDVLRIHKMLAAELDAPEPDCCPAPNPLMLALTTWPCSVFGNQVHAPGSFEAWHGELNKHARKELERVWRVFTRSSTAQFEMASGLPRALQLFEHLEEQQSLRMREQGKPYHLDGADCKAFHRRVIELGLPDGSVYVGALADEGQIVVAQFGVTNGRRFIALRQCLSDAQWHRCSPGRLVNARTAREMHARGRRWFDFGIGDYPHKRLFGAVPIPLYDACEPLSARGSIYAAAWRARRLIKQVPGMVRLVRRFRPPPIAAAGD